MATVGEPGTGVAKEADASLTQLATKWLQACVERDGDYVCEHSVDEPKGSFTSVGTSGGAWDLLGFADHLRGLKKVGWSGLEPKGYVFGDTAWFTGIAEGLLPWGQPLTIRLTLILNRVGGDWKVAHSHVSEGVDRAGIELE